jgi:hypothetical protein
VTVTPLADITSLMDGTEAPWNWEVETAYVDGISTAFTWTDGVLDIPTYAGGVVLVEFTLYLIYNSTSRYFPKDPTDSGSDPVFWEARLTSFISYSTSIKSFETGLTEISIGSIGIRLDDEWMPLIQQTLILPNRIVRIYQDDVISFKGITTRLSVNDATITISIQKRQTILDSECNWGDPAYLNRIDRSSSNAFYTGSSIPEQYQNFAIPMVFGGTTPYDVTDNSELEIGNPVVVFLIPPSTKAPAHMVDTGRIMLRVIPTSATTGIIGRMPAYQTFTSTPINEALTGTGHFWDRYEQANNATAMDQMIPGSICILERTGGTTPLINPARLYNKKKVAPVRSYFYLGIEDPTVGAGNYDIVKDANENAHFFSSQLPDVNWTGPTILSGTLTDGGHRWLTISVTGIDLRTCDSWVVLDEISGAGSGPEVIQFALETHGYSVDAASFSDMATEFPDEVVMQAGWGTQVPNLGNFLGEINRSLLTVLVFPAGNDEPELMKIDPLAPSTQTLDEYQIADISWSSEYRDQVKNIIFSPAYYRSDYAKDTLTFNIEAPRASIWGSEKTLTINHVLGEISTSRFDEIVDFYGSPVTTVRFTLLDSDVVLDISDIVTIDHSEFQQKIIVTAIEQLPIGRAIQGRYLYVN